jgi:catalase
LSIVRNGPESFAGRKVGVLVTDGTDAATLDALAGALSAEGALMEIVAPTIGGVTASDGRHVDADQNIDGGPSVLYDAVAVLPSPDGADVLATNAAAKDFVTDAHAHCKLIGRNDAAAALLDATGLSEHVDDGYVSLDNGDATKFVERCRALRFWDREPTVTEKPARR